VDHLEATGEEAARDRGSEVVGFGCRQRALFGPPDAAAGALVDAARRGLATDFNPGSAFCESLRSAARSCTQLRLSRPRHSPACTVNAAHVLGRGDRLGRLAPGYRADIVLLDRPTAVSAYHLGAGSSTRSWSRGDRELGWSYAIEETAAPPAQEKRHEYEFVYVDGEGTSSRSSPTAWRSDEGALRVAQRLGRPHPRRSSRPPAAAGWRTPPQPSWNRALKRGGLLGDRRLSAFSFTAKGTGERAAARTPLYRALHPVHVCIDRFAYRRWDPASGRRVCVDHL